MVPAGTITPNQVIALLLVHLVREGGTLVLLYGQWQPPIC